MPQLSREAFGRARQFLLERARPLEGALFLHRFEGAPVGPVLSELARFQNRDGGFGNALEPDLCSPSSSAYPTGIGLRMLADLGCPPDHPMVRRSVEYLLTTYNPETHVWRATPADTHSYPHAPWWHDENGSLEPRFDGFRIIPRALIVGSLLRYATLVPEPWLQALTEETVCYIAGDDSFGEGGGSDLEYAVYLADSEGLDEPQKSRLEARIRAAIPAMVVRDPAKWDSYGLTPLRAVVSPDAVGADLIADDLQRYLDYQIAHQAAEGTWNPTWSWFGSYPEDWPRARVEWCGRLTLETLTQMRAFGRLEEQAGIPRRRRH